MPVTRSYGLIKTIREMNAESVIEESDDHGDHTRHPYKRHIENLESHVDALHRATHPESVLRKQMKRDGKDTGWLDALHDHVKKLDTKVGELTEYGIRG